MVDATTPRKKGQVQGPPPVLSGHSDEGGELTGRARVLFCQSVLQWLVAQRDRRKEPVDFTRTWSVAVPVRLLAEEHAAARATIR